MVWIAWAAESNPRAIGVLKPLEPCSCFPDVTERVVEILIDARPECGTARRYAIGLGAKPMMKEVLPAVCRTALKNHAVPRTVCRCEGDERVIGRIKVSRFVSGNNGKGGCQGVRGIF